MMRVVFALLLLSISAFHSPLYYDVQASAPPPSLAAVRSMAPSGIVVLGAENTIAETDNFVERYSHSFRNGRDNRSITPNSTGWIEGNRLKLSSRVAGRRVNLSGHLKIASSAQRKSMEDVMCTNNGGLAYYVTPDLPPPCMFS